MIMDEIFSEDNNYLEEMGDLNKVLENSNAFMKDYHFDDMGGSQLIVKMINKSTNPNPEYNKLGDSGFDLRADLPDGPVILKTGKIMVIPTGLYFKVPFHHEMQIRSRSGLAAKHGIMVLNSPGTVDENYIGMVMAIMYNTGAIGDFAINHGDRICQAVICPVIHNTRFEVVDKLEETNRGENGLGSTQIK